MVCLIYSKDQQTSANVASALKDLCGFAEEGGKAGIRVFRSGADRMLEIRGDIINSEDIDLISGKEVTVFLSKHSSARGIGAFTVHATGNWGGDAPFGGKPMSLSVASPAGMLSVLGAISRNHAELNFSYEATHHGPLTSAPSFFAELGGDESSINSTKLAGVLAESVGKFLENPEVEYDKVAIGIGGTHYPNKFTRLAVEGKYAFGHIMPKYNIHEDMLGQAVERSDLEVETAVIDWKSLNSEQKGRIVSELDRMGVGYEKA